MPPRIARSSIQSGGSSSKGRSNARNPKKAQKRALDAYAIAEHENLDSPKIRKNRLGEFDPAFNRKRARDDDEDNEEDEDEDEDEGPKRRKRRTGDESYDEGSDSEGNTWQMGHVDNDDSDDSIDSDEAFGDSDEERFEGFTFRGSSKSQKNKPKKSKRQQNLQDEDDGINLDEGDSADGEEDYDEDDLGEDAIDLATALDQYEEDEAEERREKNKQKKRISASGDSDDEPSDNDVMGSDDDFESFSEDESDNADDRQAQLQDLISSLASKEDDGKPKGKRVEVHESAAPDEFGVARKVDLLSLKPKVADAEKKKALKLLEDDKSSKRNDIARKLDAPLPKRAQDKLDRAAANAKANETLERWTDTIKRNRRAEHLMFPLQNASGGEPTGEKTLQPTTTAAPTNDLESTIQSILQQSGLSNGKEDEEKLQKWEELQTNKLPMEEVLKRRAELRMQRELLFREEVRAKRIKKIKSKSYRRVHRKEREKMLEKEREQLKADGVDLSEEEREYNDRRRAEERMGAKHRESKWAKGIKATGRAAWDQDALDGVTEMAKRNEELRRRVEGKAIRDDEEGSDVPSDEESEDDEQSDEDALQKSLGKLKENPFSTGKSKLGMMAFMQRSEAARRAENDEAVERIRRDLADEDSDEDEIDENATKAGRRRYGPNGNVAAPAIQVGRSEFEEHAGSDDEQPAAKNEDSAPELSSNRSSAPKRNGISGLSNGTRKERNAAPAQTAENESGSSNPFLVKAKKEKKTPKEPEPFPVTEIPKPVVQEQTVVVSKPAAKAKVQKKSKPVEKPQETKVDDFLKQRITAADDDGWATVLGGQDDEEDQDDEDIENEGIDLDIVMRNQALTAKGFAGDDVVAEFDAEKKATITEEETTETTSILPGWGAWTGEGMSKAEKKRNIGTKTVIHKSGIDAAKRKDKKLDKVIINERRVKPNTKYMASQLPFPFENREQYERSLRVPKGKEWVTKKTHQDVTRPRVIVKQGIIKPLRKPLA
ncbi:hypothetical protein COCSADRAFT_126619 [Bipolaris sorokiniana ND90Pr]|uniref:Uncharacterized protein n=1 Tax=Cochliobolus sativus (strain ND90Pr / ATCC 201652) TaxID=665912 RepID=M2STX2_COCSN|nr:uncharacterized protein COCSADRAFT_126619 [Bipolaris sorokiniana ND90Pr]EMD60222.1 hypothetical protein COCSADRAFT_126619 [Bipolaris sorokiniana ND90Pr]